MTSTLEKLQLLKDAEFHCLGDELLPRISPEYFPITPNGRNERGDSIVGNPDSYVGNSAKTSRIAIEYTVQSKGWWNKVIKDVRDAKTACEQAKEIVLFLPRDVDREKPTKGDGVEWLATATSAATPAKLSVYSGKAICHLLDTTCQDLRLKYLGIPFSTLSWHALTSNAISVTESMLDRLKALGRYSPEHYLRAKPKRRNCSMRLHWNLLSPSCSMTWVISLDQKPSTVC